MTTTGLLLAEREIQRLCVRYLDRVDARDAEGAAALFAQDAVADYLTGRPYEGRAAIARVLDRILAQFERTSHHLSNHSADVDLDAGTATAVSYVYAFHRLAGSGAPWHFWGRHVDRLRRVDGVWLLAERHLVAIDTEPVREGVGRDLFAGHDAIERILA
jgi:uncharacterized protein (TIGR02246 family)